MKDDLQRREDARRKRTLYNSSAMVAHREERDAKPTQDDAMRRAHNEQNAERGARHRAARIKLNQKHETAVSRHHRTSERPPTELEKKYKLDAAAMEEEHRRETERYHARQRAERDRAKG